MYPALSAEANTPLFVTGRSSHKAEPINILAVTFRMVVRVEPE
jgi:hypothetical protein